MEYNFREIEPKWQKYWWSIRLTRLWKTKTRRSSTCSTCFLTPVVQDFM